MWVEESGQAVVRTVFLLTFLAMLLFVGAYLVRKKNLKLHVGFAVLATLLTLLAAVHLVLNVHFYDRLIKSPYANFWVNLHRVMASITAILMLAMFFTGVFRLRTWHIAMHRFFLFMYVFVFLSGWILFV